MPTLNLPHFPPPPIPHLHRLLHEVQEPGAVLAVHEAVVEHAQDLCEGGGSGRGKEGGRASLQRGGAALKIRHKRAGPRAPHCPSPHASTAPRSLPCPPSPHLMRPQPRVLLLAGGACAQLLGAHHEEALRIGGGGEGGSRRVCGEGEACRPRFHSLHTRIHIHSPVHLHPFTLLHSPRPCSIHRLPASRG